MKAGRRVEGVVDRADHLPVDMRSDAEAAEIAMGRSAEAVAKVVAIATADQRIAPARAAVYSLRSKEAGVERQIGGEAPSAKAETGIGDGLGSRHGTAGDGDDRQGYRGSGRSGGNGGVARHSPCGQNRKVAAMIGPYRFRVLPARGKL
jgi:hypothetical protein